MKDNNLPQNDELRDDLVEDTADSAEDTAAASTTSEKEVVEASETDVEESTQDRSDEEVEDAADAADTDADEDADETKPEESGKRKKEHVDRRRLRYGGMATGMTAAVVAIVILINVVAGILNDRFPMNLDLTAEKLFTLTDESRAIAKGIKKDTEIIIFAEESTFSAPNTGDDNYNTIFKQFYESTRQYNSLSGGKIKTTYVDLVGSPTLASKYTEYDVKEGDILFRSGTRWQKVGVSDLFSYNQESYYQTGQITDFSSKVENVMASKIAMVTSENTPIVTILTGHTEDADTLAGIKSVISINNYTTEDLDITASAKFNEKSTIALIAAPKTDYSAAEIDKLRTWLNNGGKFNRQLVVVANLEGKCPNLYEFLNVEYGIEVTDNLILETDANRMYNYNAYYPYGDIATSDYTANITGKRMLMPVTREILTNKENNTDNSLYNVDIVTFPESSKLVKLADALAQTEETADVKQTAAKQYPTIGMAYATKWGYNSDNERYATNVLVCGSQQAFLSDVMGLTSVENERTLISLINCFTGNESAVTISSKSLEKTKLEFTTGQANIFFIIFVAAIPLALLAVCLVVFIRRRRL